MFTCYFKEDSGFLQTPQMKSGWYSDSASFCQGKISKMKCPSHFKSPMLKRLHSKFDHDLNKCDPNHNNP